MTTARRTATLFVVLAGAVVGLALTALSCTVLVQSTGTNGDSSAHQGDTVQGTATIDHAKEADSRCDNNDSSRGCDYSLGVVNPSKVDNSTGSGSKSDTCHYGTPQSAADSQFDTIADHTEVNHTVVSGGTETEVDGSGKLGNTDDVGDAMADGDTLMCFYSSASDASADHVNGADDGAAAATDPMAFEVL